MVLNPFSNDDSMPEPRLPNPLIVVTSLQDIESKIKGYDFGVDTAQDMLQKADQALCTAKSTGKNHVCSASETVSDRSIPN